MVFRPCRGRIFKTRLICNRGYATAGLESVVAFAQWKQIMTIEQKLIAEEIISQVNNYFVTDCRIKSRKLNIVKPRQYACKIIRELTGMVYQDIATFFGQKHENVMHAIKVVDNDLYVMPKYKEYYIELRSIVEGTEVYKNSSLAKKNVVSDVRRELYNIITSKSVDELKELLKLIK